MGYDSLRVELRYRHIWQTKWAAQANGGDESQQQQQQQQQPGGGRGGRRATSLNRNVHYEGDTPGPGMPDPDDPSQQPANYNATSGGPGAGPGAAGGGPGSRGRHKSYRHYRSAEAFMEEDRDMRIVVRGGVYEVDLAEWKCHSIYWPGEAFDILRGTWFQEFSWQPLNCEDADRIEQEHLNRFRGHKMADYVWDAASGTRLEKQVRCCVFGFVCLFVCCGPPAPSQHNPVVLFAKNWMHFNRATQNSQQK